MMNLKGNSREQIESICSKLSRRELTEIICKQALVEQLLRPSEIARSSSVPRKTVSKAIREGKFGDYFLRAENSVLVRWLRLTALSL